MFTKLLLIGSALLANGSVLTLDTHEKVLHEPQKAYNPLENQNFYKLTDLFPEYTFYWSGELMSFEMYIDAFTYMDLPDITLDYLYFGDFAKQYDFYAIEMYQEGEIGDRRGDISRPLTEEFPFSSSSNDPLYYKYSFLQMDFPVVYRLSFEFFFIPNFQQRSEIQLSIKNNFAFTNELGIADYVEGIAYDNYINGYTKGFTDGDLTTDGNWLGGLVFGTIGGIVGLLFTISDFEVLGVSIMSIITLFVAIGIIMLLIKVLK